MSEILRTDSILGHYHVVYLPDVPTDPNIPVPTPVTSFDDGHFHEVTFDPNLGQWVIGFGPDGHGHGLEPISTVSKKPTDKTEAEVLQEVWDMFRSWAEQEEQSRKDAKTAEDFYWGEQWESSQKTLLESQGRAALTINGLERMVDGLCGEERQERTDLRFLPQEGGDQKTADILNHLVKHILESCYYGREKSKAFEDQVVTGRGNLNVWVDFRTNLEGDIKVESFPWSDVVYAPHEKEDLEDCEGLVKHKMFSRARLRSMYPKFADKIDSLFTPTLDDPLDTTVLKLDYDTGYYAGGYPQFVAGMTTIDILRKDLRVIECWRKVYETGFVLVNPQDNFYFLAEDWKETDVNKVKTIPGFFVVEREMARMRITKVCGNLVLSDDYPADLPVDDFFIVPVYGKKKGNRWKGKVLSGIDPQREINHRHSQAVDIGNRTSGYGWFYTDATFPDEIAKKNFEKYSSAPGFKLKVADTNHPPLKVEGGKFPVEIVQLLQLSDAALTATLSMELGQGGANESAAHLLERKKARMLPNEFLFDNLAFAQKKLGKLLIKAIQRYYTPSRILRILQSKNKPGQEVQVGGQPVENYSEDEIISLLQTVNLAEYDVEVAESGYSPTARMATFMLLSEMARSGAPIAPELMIEFMDIPADLKARIQASMAQQSEQGALAQKATAKMEINKTLIGQGIIPPEVQAELGQAPQAEPIAAQPPVTGNELQ